MDEFAFPPENPFLGKQQFLHRIIEIALWSAGFTVAIAGQFAAILESGSARRAAREERERGDESQRTVARTQEQLAVFDLAIEQATEAVVVLDIAGYIVYANQAFHRMLSLPQGSAVGRDARELNTSRMMPAGTVLAAVLRDGSWTVGEVDGPRADGSIGIIRAVATVFRDVNGAPAGVVIIAGDMTEERRLQAALRASEERYRIIA